MPARTSCSACESGPIATSRRSRASQAAGAIVSLKRGPGGRVDAIRRAAERNFAQRQQVALAEEAIGGDAGLLRVIDLAGLEPGEQVVRWQVDQLDFVGLVEDAVRDGLPLPNARDLGDEIVEAFEVLDIHGRPDVEAGVEQLLDVLPALRVPRTRLAFDEVRVCELVDQDDLGTAPQGGVEIKLAAHRAAVPYGQYGKLLEPLHQALGLVPAMRLDVSHDDVAAGGALDARRLQHCIRLADACGCAEENAKPPAPRAGLLGLHGGEQLIGVRPPSGRVHVSESGAASGFGVQGEVEFEHVHARLAKDTESPPARGSCIRFPAPRSTEHAPSPRNPGHLVLGRRRRDVRIQTASG